MLGPVVLGFSLLAGGLRPAHSRSNRRGPRFREMIPWFISGFLALLLIRSLGLISAAVVQPVTHTAALLTTIAMAGLGLGVDLRTVVRTGLRRSNRRGPRFREMIPWFISGFLALLLIRSLGLIPAAVVQPVTHTAALLTTIAMAGLGLGVDLRTVVRTGLRVTLAVTVSLLVLGVVTRLSGYRE